MALREKVFPGIDTRGTPAHRQSTLSCAHDAVGPSATDYDLTPAGPIGCAAEVAIVPLMSDSGRAPVDATWAQWRSVAV
jgi:hypothetical protein